MLPFFILQVYIIAAAEDNYLLKPHAALQKRLLFLKLILCDAF